MKRFRLSAFGPATLNRGMFHVEQLAVTEPSAVADGAAACFAAALYTFIDIALPGDGHPAISSPSATADGSVQQS
ncbi:MAG TPA: hypothetical protein VJR04_04600 [Terriglobales bacterium]|nr:hypothetical protein [Terriglobales bacterium]